MDQYKILILHSMDIKGPHIVHHQDLIFLINRTIYCSLTGLPVCHLDCVSILCVKRHNIKL